MKKQLNQRGQALLVVLLVMVVAITLGLGVISQSITDIKISQEEEESSRAFNLAEAGLEEALRALGSGSDFNWTDPTTGDQYAATVSEEGAAGFVSATPVNEGDVIQLRVNGVETDVKLYWQSKALEVIIFSNNAGTHSLERLALDPDDADLMAPNGSSGTYGSQSFSRSHTINTTAQTEFIRIRPLYDNSYIGIERTGSSDLPTQYYQVTATGKTNSGVTRKLELTREIEPALPSVFDYALFSGTTINK